MATKSKYLSAVAFGLLISYASVGEATAQTVLIHPNTANWRNECLGFAGDKLPEEPQVRIYPCDQVRLPGAHLGWLLAGTTDVKLYNKETLHCLVPSHLDELAYENNHFGSHGFSSLQAYNVGAGFTDDRSHFFWQVEPYRQSGESLIRVDNTTPADNGTVVRIRSLRWDPHDRPHLIGPF